MKTHRVIVIGAGVGGLTTAALLAARGIDVVVAERAATPGGKIREVDVAGQPIDSGPTVFTMRPVFEQIFSDAGESLDRCLALTRADTIARHAWGPDDRLDLFSEIDRSVDAIAAFAGPDEGRRYQAFCDRSRRIFNTLEHSFMHKPRPTPLSLVWDAGLTGLPDMWRIQPYVTLWNALGRYFKDQRLRQLFGRYSTYCGSSPFASPGTLMLIAHVEREGVWFVEGGMRRIADALTGLAERNGATVRFNAHVSTIGTTGPRAGYVILSDGERIDADAIVVNADPSAIADGHFGPAVAASVNAPPKRARSLSAVTWSMVAETDGFPLLHHSVFFSPDYRAEFDTLIRHKRLPSDPTVYICAQDRGGTDNGTDEGPERLFCLVNAPATGDGQPLSAEEFAECEEGTFKRLGDCGLRIHRSGDRTVTTTPAQFDSLFPATGGALYGRASHGWMASFQRPTARTSIPGLYLAGGSTHPGAGLPMAALSGRLAAQVLLRDLASTNR